MTVIDTPPDPEKHKSDKETVSFQKPEEFISEVEDWCKKNNLRPATVCSRATNNTYLLESIRRRTGRTESDKQKVRAYMAEHEKKKAAKAAKAAEAKKAKKADGA